MRLSDIMTAHVRTIDSSATVGRAWAVMQEQGIHHLVVLEGARVVGVLSERDLGGRRGPAADDGRVVANVMSAPVVTAEPTTTLRQAANLLRGRQLGCLPVMDGDRLLGMVTTTDVLELVGRGTERPVGRSKRYTLRHRGGNSQAAPHRR